MGLLKKGLSAIGKFFIVLALAGAFIVGMVGVVYMSLVGQELKIPEVVGKNFDESEKELASLGLKIKKIATRYSEEPPNTILEQRPRAGESAKTGLMVSVIVAQPNPEGTEKPADVRKKSDDEESIEEIEELISDKPKKSNKANQNTNKKKSSTTRDVIKENSNENSNSTTGDNSKNDSKSNTSGSGNSDDKKTPISNNKPTTPANLSKPAPVKPPSTTKPTDGDVRNRRVPPSN
ncbi:MAG TPA: PASTA domain-containing protein [Pyrinomonadaceae bacterium]|nr:PASTA domain-containing protein [Pyrinomonadaceae bacterium]